MAKRKDLSKLWVELEWRRCALDEKYFFDNYVFIPSEEDPRGRCRFVMFDYQEELFSLLKHNRFVVALKARQLGYTTLAMAHALWLAMFRPGANVLIVSRNQKSSNKNLAQARLAWRFLPQWMRERSPKLVSDSTDGMSFAFPDGMISQLKASAATAGVFAGETASLVILDEAGLVEPAALQEDVLRTLLPTTEAGGSMAIISTARGAYNRFAKTYRAAKRGDSMFVPFFQPWSSSPFMRCSDDCGWCSGPSGGSWPCNTKYDLRRREFADEPWRFFQEYPSDDEEAFRESGRPRFTGLPAEDKFEDFPYRGDVVWGPDNELMFEHDIEGPLRLSTLDPDPAGFYVLAADPSQGRGADFSAAHLLTANSDGDVEIVGWYRSNTVQPPEFAAALDRLGRFFKGRQWAATLAVEDQGGQGALPVNELQRHLEYPNPYVHHSPGARKQRGSRLFAFPMTVDRRRSVIDRLGKYLTVQDGEVPLSGIYPELRVELGQFVAQQTAAGNVRYAADVGCHDDLVMSLAIAVWVLVEEYFEGGSPLSADSSDATSEVSGPTFSLRPIVEARRAAEEFHEEQQRRQMELLMLNTRLM